MQLNCGTLTLLWLAFGVLSSAALYSAKRGCSRRAKLAIAIAAGLVDVWVPCSYSYPDALLFTIETYFMFGFLRASKGILAAFDRGPLSGDLTFPQFLTISLLPVMPLKALPEPVQRRMQPFQASLKQTFLILCGLALSLIGCLATCLYDDARTSALWRYPKHLAIFIGYITSRLLFAASLAQLLGAPPLANPFNSFFLATSVAEWWNTRWNMVVSPTLRMCVYQPVIDSYTSRNKRVPDAVRAAAGVGTFALSGLIHEYSIMTQRQFSCLGPVTLFFLLQPVLIAVQPPLVAALDWLLLKATPLPTGVAQRLVRHGTTGVFVAGPVLWLWCAAYASPENQVVPLFSRQVVEFFGIPGLGSA